MSFIKPSHEELLSVSAWHRFTSMPFGGVVHERLRSKIVAADKHEEYAQSESLPRHTGYRAAHLMLTPMTPPEVADVITLVTKTRQYLALSDTTYP